MAQQIVSGWTNGPYVEDGVLIIPQARIVMVKNADGTTYEMPTSPSSGGGGEIDGGSASSTYQTDQIIDCGDANG